VSSPSSAVQGFGQVLDLPTFTLSNDSWPGWGLGLAEIPDIDRLVHRPSPWARAAAL